MEVASEIVRGVVQVLMVPVKKQLDYLISYKKYVDDMHHKMKDLDAARVGVESQKKQNRERLLEVPAQVDPWLIEAEQMNKNVEEFPSEEVLGCLDLKSRYKLGKKAFNIFKEIESVLGRCPEIRGTELQIPLGRIDSNMASTSTLSGDHNDFQSRVKTYNKALEALGPDHKPHMVALWGMGGVGKTTMMRKLRQAVVEKKMFSYFVQADIGANPDVNAIQESIASYLGIQLKDQAKQVRVDELRQGFEAKLKGGAKKFLVILDDVWQPVDLEDIGLSRLPNQGVDFKVLLVSRNKDVCTEMGVKADSVLNVGLLTEAEAQSLFCQLWEPSDDVDPELHKIGEEIVRKCGGLPIVIKTMACTLRSKSMDTWKNALSRLQHHDFNTIVPTVFKTSYENLQDEETEATFLLCGLFPEDFNIPTEDLLRYGWGIKLFKGVGTIREARYRLNACIERLMHTNLLIESDAVGRVKMHDLVRAFVMHMFSKIEHASLVNHGCNPGWPETENNLSVSCKRISLTCKGMTEFPSDLKFPNLLILKLMHGDKSLRFPQGFYEEMRKLQVISYDHMMYPLLSLSLECSTNLRVLRLHECSLAFDFSNVGNLLNLEVLSVAKSGIKSLPSTFGNLKKLRVLDLTDCDGLRIDNDVFKNLVRLEELWAFGGAISFTGDNCNEVAERWKKLSALEFEFHNNNAQQKNLSFENLERFKISVGCSLYGGLAESTHSFGNTLKLVTKKDELLGSRINELFDKTVVLCLSVVDMNDLEDVEVKSSLYPQSSSFRNLRVLVVSECVELKYLFTLGVVKVLSNLEHLYVFDCLVMKELLHIESGGEETIEFPKLKTLFLSRLPNLSGLCQNVNLIALPQLVVLNIEGIPNITSIYSKNKSETSCLLREEVLIIPKLECLLIEDMNNLKEIWPINFQTSNEKVKLREIHVIRCDNLVNLFPYNPMPFMHHLEELQVERCASIESLFNMDFNCVGEIEKGSSSSNLRSIIVSGCDNLVNLFPCNPMPLMHHLEELQVERCASIESLFNMDFDCVGEIEKGTSSSNLRSIIVSGCDNLVNLFPCNPIPLMCHLEKLKVKDCGSMEALFNIGLNCPGEIQNGSNSSTLRSIKVSGCKNLVSLFPCNPMPFLPHLEELKVKDCGSIESLFNINLDCVGEIEKGSNSSLTSIIVSGCKNLVNLFPSNPMPLMHRLEVLEVWDCGSIVALFNIDFNYVAEIEKGSRSSLRSIKVSGCKNIVNLFPYNPMPLLHRLEVLEVWDCGSIEALFNINLDCVGEIEKGCSSLRSIDVVDLGKLREVWRIKGGENNSCLPIRGFQAVESISIRECKRFRFLFTHTTTNFDIGALIDLNIYDCGEIVRNSRLMESNQGQEINIMSKEETSELSDSISNYLFPSCLIHSFHNIHKLQLERCQGVEVIFEIESPQSQDNKCRIFPYLEELYIRDMERMSHVWKCNWNKFFILQKHEPESPFHNLTTIYMINCHSMKYLFSPLMAKLLSNLKKTEIIYCEGIEEVVSHKYDEDKEQTTSTSTHTSTTLFPHLDCLTLSRLQSLKCIGGGEYKFSQLDGVSWSLCQYPREISIRECHALSSVIPCYAAGQMQKLHMLKIDSCCGIKEVFETQGINRRVIMLKLSNLKILQIEGCDLLEHIFTFSTLETLRQLEELWIQRCKTMKVIVKQEEDDGEQTTSSFKAVVFPRLKCIKLVNLPELVGFFLGTNDFQWPSLGDFVIKDCPEMKVFTAGGSTTPQLKYVETSLGKYSLGCWFNSHVTTATTGQHQESTSFSCPAATSEGIHWSFHNLIELHVTEDSSVEKIIFPSNQLLHLQKLEKIHISSCFSIEEVFEAMEGTNDTGFVKSTIVKLPNLIQVNLLQLPCLRCMWKSNQWTLFEFPNLKIVSIIGCGNLQHVFSSSMVGSLKQLQELHIGLCSQMEEAIVKDANTVVVEEEEESDGKMSEIILPRLKSLILYNLPCLKGFCLTKEDFSFPLLDTLIINQCPTIMTFTMGSSSTPELKGIETSFGLFYIEEDINSFIKMKQEEFKRSSLLDQVVW